MLHAFVLCLSLLLASPVLATVPESPAVDRYTSNGITSSYPYTFKIYSKNDLAVYVDNVLKALDIDYTVTGVANDGGGVISLLTVPATGLNIIILRNQPNQQYSVYTQNGFSPTQVEKDLDKLTMQVQELSEQLTRALKFIPSYTATATVDTPTEGAFARAKVGGGVDWATPSNSVISTPISIANGGTGATSAAAAATSLGLIPESGAATIDAKGDILAGISDNMWTKLPIGSNGSVLTANSAQATGLQWVASGAALLSAGDVKFTINTVADSGWVLMNDGTIGNASCGCSNRSNSDTQTLYELIWTNIADQWAPVVGGRGASAADDFNANKKLTLPRSLGRALAGYGAAVSQATGSNADVDTTGNTLTVPSNTTTWVTGMPVVFTLTSGSVTGLTSGVTYYIVRQTSTTVHLASTLANAQNGTTIDFTGKSSPVWSITHTGTTRNLGEYAGENEHAMSISELLAHTHGSATTTGASGSGAGTLGGGVTGFAGGNVPMNTLQPTLFLNVMIKL